MNINEKNKVKEWDTDQKVTYFYNQISPEVEQSFTPPQKEEIKKLIKRVTRAPSKKLVDIRFTFWFIKRIFAVILIGVSKRKKERKPKMTGLQKFLAVEFKIIFYILEIMVCLLGVMFILLLIRFIFGVKIF